MEGIMNRMILGVFIVSSMIISCASFTKNEPQNTDDSLIIGQIEFKCVNFDYYGPVTVNGTNKEGVEVKINDLTTGEQKTAIANQNGLFTFYNLSTSHQYQITELYYIKSQGNASADAILYPGNKYNFIPVLGKVLSIGSYKGYLDKSTKKGSLEKNNSDVIDAFKKQFKDSKWNSYSFIIQE
jgi:hypothetical protein